MNLFGWIAVGCVGVIVLVLLIGWLVRRRSGRHARMWKPLESVVRGTVQGHGMKGEYHGLPVFVHLATISGSRCFFVTTAKVPEGGTDWTVAWQSDGLLSGNNVGWRVRSTDKALAQRLRAAGVLESVKKLPHEATAKYTRDGSLRVSMPVPNLATVPNEQQFKAVLQMMLDLVEVDHRTNQRPA